MRLYDVLIVGGGPAGSYVAYKLAGMGYGVVVIEQKEGLDAQVCCTGIISQECVSSFFIADDIVLRQASSATLIPPSGKPLRLWRSEPQACIIDRAGFNAVMARRAQDKGVEYVLGSLVRDVEVVDDKVRVEAARQGENFNFEARAAVVATGFGSSLPQGLGLGKVGDFVMGTQAEVEVVGVDEVEAYFGKEVAPGFFAWLVPTLPPKALAGLLSRRSPGFYLKKLMTSLMARGKIVSDEVKLSYRGVSLKPPARTYGNRLVVVGDAAGQVKPTTGGGIYYGLLCADIAANTLHRALESDDLSAKSLAGYEEEWKKKLGWELKIGYWARKLYERLSDAQIDKAFDIIKSKGIDEALLKEEALSFDWHGKAVSGLIKRRVLSMINVLEVPFHLGRRD
ncbi:NAD(P)/FAD-dependent oxidoreductase [Chloroflexota bacterium]